MIFLLTFLFACKHLDLGCAQVCHQPSDATASPQQCPLSWIIQSYKCSLDLQKLAPCNISGFSNIIYLPWRLEGMQFISIKNTHFLKITDQLPRQFSLNFSQPLRIIVEVNYLQKLYRGKTKKYNAVEYKVPPRNLDARNGSFRLWIDL